MMDEVCVSDWTVFSPLVPMPEVGTIIHPKGYRCQKRYPKMFAALKKLPEAVTISHPKCYRCQKTYPKMLTKNMPYPGNQFT
jgi:hypothetical protein